MMGNAGAVPIGEIVIETGAETETAIEIEMTTGTEDVGRMVGVTAAAVAVAVVSVALAMKSVVVIVIAV